MSIHPLDRSVPESFAALRAARDLELARTLGEPVAGPGTPYEPALGPSLAADASREAGATRDPGTGAIRPTHTAMMAVDICAFGGRADDDMQLHLRRTMYELLAGAFTMTLLPWEAAYREDRGDGALIILPPTVPAEALLDPFAHHLRALLRRSNRFASDTARLRMRVAVHAGDVHVDAHGVAGRAVILLFRLLECRRFKRLLSDSGADVGLIVSEQLYQDAAHRPGLVDAGTYRQITAWHKETRTRARVWLPPQIRPDQ